jgi:hypothetical protein
MFSASMISIDGSIAAEIRATHLNDEWPTPTADHVETPHSEASFLSVIRSPFVPRSANRASHAPRQLSAPPQPPEQCRRR